MNLSSSGVDHKIVVRGFKTTFKKVIALRTLLYDVVQKVITQVKAVLNFRLLTPVDNNP